MKLKYGPYSPSRLETALCGHAFFKQYIAKEQGSRGSSLPQARGSVVHEVFERMTAVRVADVAAAQAAGLEELPPFDIPKEALRAWIAEAINRYPEAYAEIEDITKMATLYLARPPEHLTSDAGIELKLAVKHDGNAFVECDYHDPEAFARGRADIMVISDCTTKALVYDHKTQPNIVDDSDTFQLGFYAWVISKIYPFLEEIHTVIHLARYGKYAEVKVWTKEDLARIEDEILTRISIIEARTEWQASPNKQCQYCPFVMECPTLEGYFERREDGSVAVVPGTVKILGSTAKAVEIAGMINVLEELLKSAKTELKKFVKEYGPVAIPGKIYDNKVSESIDWDKANKKLRATVLEILERHKVKPSDYMCFSESASKTIWFHKNEKLVRELSKALPRKVSARFDGYKV